MEEIVKIMTHLMRVRPSYTHTYRDALNEIECLTKIAALQTRDLHRVHSSVPLNSMPTPILDGSRTLNHGVLFSDCLPGQMVSVGNVVVTFSVNLSFPVLPRI